MSVVHPLELSHHPKWNSSTLYQQKSFIIADPPKKFHTKFHITWVHATLHLILIYIVALETHLYDMPRTQQSIWPGPHPVPLTTEGEQKGTNASFLFLSSSSVSRHGALSCCPRRTPFPCHWSSLTDVSNFALLSWIFSQVSLGSFELIHLISHTWPKSCPILSFRAVHWGQSFPPVCIFLSLYCCSLADYYVDTHSLWASTTGFFVQHWSGACSLDHVYFSTVGLSKGMVAKQDVVLIIFPQVPKLYLWESKIFLSSKIMNYQPKHIHKREIVDIQKIKYKHKSKKEALSYSS